MEEKVSKRSLEAAGKASLAASGPGLLPRKPPGLAAGPAGTYGKAMSPPPSPRASPVAALKAKVIQKLEDVSKPPPTYAYPATPSSHPSSPPPASPPPTPGITRKEEAPENVVEKKDLELEKEAPSPFQALFSGRSKAETLRAACCWRNLPVCSFTRSSIPSSLLSPEHLGCTGPAARLWEEHVSSGEGRASTAPVPNDPGAPPSALTGSGGCISWKRGQKRPQAGWEPCGVFSRACSWVLSGEALEKAPV